MLTNEKKLLISKLVRRYAKKVISASLVVAATTFLAANIKPLEEPDIEPSLVAGVNRITPTLPAPTYNILGNNNIAVATGSFDNVRTIRDSSYSDKIEEDIEIVVETPVVEQTVAVQPEVKAELVVAKEVATPVQPKVEQVIEQPTVEVVPEEPTNAEVTQPEPEIVPEEPAAPTGIPTCEAEVTDYAAIPFINSKYEFEVFCAYIYAEAGNQSDYCQALIADTPLNMMDHPDKYPQNLMEVIQDSNRFSTWPYMIKNAIGNVPQRTRDIAVRELYNRTDYNVMCYRTKHYHGFGTPYCHVGAVWFSTL